MRSTLSIYSFFFSRLILRNKADGRHWSTNHSLTADCCEPIDGREASPSLGNGKIGEIGQLFVGEKHVPMKTG